jgi:hypothetical protein
VHNVVGNDGTEFCMVCQANSAHVMTRGDPYVSMPSYCPP